MATAAINQMQTFMVSFNPKDKRAMRFFEALRIQDYFRVEECPYDPEYVAKIKAIDAQDKRKFKAIKSDDIWK